MSTNLDDRREARLARMKAARETAQPFGPDEEITVADLRVGDFLVVVPSQNGVRGIRVNSLVTQLDGSWESWKQGRCPVPSRQVRFGARSAAYPLGEHGLDVPDSFRCTVRRPR